MLVAELKIIVPELWLNVGEFETVRFPEISKFPEEPGAVKVPPEKTMFPLISKSLLVVAVSVPEEIVNPPLNRCLAVEAVYVPPFTVVAPVAVMV